MTTYAKPGPFDTFEEVATAAGRSRRSVTTLARFGQVAGPVATGVGVGAAVFEIVEAPLAERPRVVAHEGGGIAGGALGAEAGAASGTALAGAVAILRGLEGPPGWLVRSLGIAEAGAGGYFGSERGRASGEAAYDAETFPSMQHPTRRAPDGTWIDPSTHRWITGPGPKW